MLSQRCGGGEGGGGGVVRVINSHSKDHLKSSSLMLGISPSSSRVCFNRDKRSDETSLNPCAYSPITFGFNIFMFKTRRTLYHSSPRLLQKIVHECKPSIPILMYRYINISIILTVVIRK